MITVAQLTANRVDYFKKAIDLIETGLKSSERLGYKKYCYYFGSSDPKDEIYKEVVKHGFKAEIKKDADMIGNTYLEITWD